VTSNSLTIKLNLGSVSKCNFVQTSLSAHRHRHPRTHARTHTQCAPNALHGH